MAEIFTRKGERILVDDADFDALNEFTWYVKRYPNKIISDKFYAQRNGRREDGTRITIFMHRQITGMPKGYDVDHWDHDGLNNQRANLRVATRSQNMCNSRLPERDLPRGVCFDPRRNNYIAQIWVDGKHMRLGSYKDPALAALAYDAASRKYHGVFGARNTPDA